MSTVNIRLNDEEPIAFFGNQKQGKDNSLSPLTFTVLLEILDIGKKKKQGSRKLGRKIEIVFLVDAMFIYVRNAKEQVKTTRTST